MECNESTDRRAVFHGARDSARLTDASPSLRDASPLLAAIDDALAKQRTAFQLARIRRSQQGRSLLRGRPALSRQSCDPDELLRLPHGTFGHELARFMIDNDVEPGSEEPESASGGSDREYLGRRLIEMHDLWHVLSGYNCDLAGEFGLLAFTLGQGHLRGVGPVLALLLRRFHDGDGRDRHTEAELARYLLRAYLRGRRARFLAPLLLEEYFMLPIDSVRQRLRIEPCEETLYMDALPPIALRPPNEHGLVPN